MPVRLRQTVSSFVAVVACYWLYALLAVPLIEPSAEALDARRSTSEERQAASDIPAQIRRRLSVLFPSGHWALDHPKFFKSRHGMLVMQDYQQLDDHRLKLEKCVMIFFRQPVGGDDVPADSVVLEASQGAILKFDDHFNLAQGKLGKLKQGELPGEITIRSTMDPHDPNDDLVIVARDIHMNQRIIRSKHPVKFRLGSSYGSGRDMEIRLLATPVNGQHDNQLPNIGGIQSFELAHDVRMNFDLGRRSLLPGRTMAGIGGQKISDTSSDIRNPPVEITCRGSFYFDLVAHEATFEEQVDVIALNRSGPSDQLRCEFLSILFERKKHPAEIRNRGAAEDVVDVDGVHGPTPESLGSLEPTLIEARGTPVVVTAPSSGAAARCEVLSYDLETGQITLDGKQPTAGDASSPSAAAQLSQGLSEIRAPTIKYRPSDVSGGLGTLWAAGPGSIRAVPNAAEPTAVLRAQWQTKLHLRRVVRDQIRQQVISLYGSPKISMAGQGTIHGREFHLWLFEPGDRASAQLARGGPEKVWPDRLKVFDAKIVDSPWVQGTFAELGAWFDHGSNVMAGAASVVAPHGSGPMAAAQNTTGRMPLEQPFDVRGELLQLQLASRGGEIDLTELTVVGKPAHVAGRGVTLDSGVIRLNLPANRFWCDQPGRITLPVTNDFQGRTLAAPDSLAVTWQDKMDFDGLKMCFYEQVVAHNQDQSQRLETGVLIGTLSERIHFDRRRSRPQNVELRELACREGVLMESRATDRQGRPTFDRIQVPSLQVNLADRLSGDESVGEIYAEGPGWIKSTRFGQAGALVPSDGTVDANSDAQASETFAAQKPDPLNFLRVDFLRKAHGNLHDKELTLVGQTRAVYGPVKQMDDELEGNSPDELGPDGMLLESEQMTVIDMATGRGEPMALELKAVGNVEVEGEAYLAKGHTMSYDYRKGWLILEGTGRTDAALYLKQAPGEQDGEFHFGKIMYSPRTKHVRFFGFKQLGASQPPSRR